MLGLLALGLALPSTSDRSCELLDGVLLATRAQTNCSTISNVDVPGYVGPKWTMAEETCFLYLIGRHSEGAIAEQGPFLGASTIAIAFGIRDSSQPRHSLPQTHSLSLHPPSPTGRGETTRILAQVPRSHLLLPVVLAVP